MGNKLNHDVIGIIYDLCNNYYCALINKEFYDIIKHNAKICPDCHKFIKIFNQVQWITDETDIYNKKLCHGYYKNLDYYKRIKKILSIHPKFIEEIDRPCFALSLYVINNHPLAIEYIKQTNELCHIALDLNIEAIKYIKNPTEDMYIKALRTNGFYIKHITQTLELCWIAIKSRIKAFQFIKDEFKTKELCLYVVEKDGLMLQYISEQSLELCWKAIYQNIEAIEYVAKEYQTEEMCMYVTKKDYHLISKIKTSKEQYYLELYDKMPYCFETKFPIEGSVAFGHHALLNNQGICNIGIGYQSGINIKNTNYNIMIGNEGLEEDNAVIRIGNKQQKNYQAGIYNNLLEVGRPVYVNELGELGVKY